MQDGPVPEQIRVLVADEISKVVQDLEAIQTTSSEIAICGLARTPSALLEEARRLQPDVIIINEQYFGVDILFAVEELVHITPGATIIELTIDPANAEKRGRRAGIHGFVKTGASTDEIVALRYVLRGRNAAGGVLPRIPTIEPGVPAPAAEPQPESPHVDPIDESTSADGSRPPEAPDTAEEPEWFGSVTAEPGDAESAPSAWAPDTSDVGAVDEPDADAHDDDEATATAAWGVRGGDELESGASAEPSAPAWGVAVDMATDPVDAPTSGAPGESDLAWVAPSDDDEPSVTAVTEATVDQTEAPVEPTDEPLIGMPEEGEAGYREFNGIESDLEPIQPVTPRRIRRGSRAKAETFFVFSGKGGVGKSTVAANLAVALAADRDAHVAVVDLDLQFGDIGVMYGIQGQHSIEVLADQGEQVDPEFLEDTMSDGPSGVRVLMAPPSPELADLVTAANLRSILRELSKLYDYVIVDGPAHLEERTLEVIEFADQLIVVTAYNVTSVKDTKVMLKVLSSLGVDKERISVVLNQTRAKISFTREQVEETLRFRVVAQLPYDPRVVDDAADHGKPFVTAEPKAEISRQLRVLVDFLSPNVGGDAKPGAASKDKKDDKVNRRRFSLGRG